jgi:magnesium-protoporphyrin O-methyltransferase
LIHYEPADIVRVLKGLCLRTRHSVLFTFAPRTAALSAMHFVGRLIPSDAHRAPSIVPVSHRNLRQLLSTEIEPLGWQIGETDRVSTGFYTSQLMELRRACLD